MRILNSASYKLSNFAAVVILAGCASSGSQVAPGGPMQQSAVRSALNAVQPASVVYTPTNVDCSVNIGHSCTFPIDLRNDGRTDFIVKERDYLVRCGYKGLALTEDVTIAPHVRVPGVVQGAKSGWAAALDYGDRIGSRQQFRRHLYSIMYSYDAGCGGIRKGGYWHRTTKYLGLTFPLNGEAHYGWAQLSVRTQTNALTTTMTGYAYETIAGKSIMAGQTK